MFLNSASKCKTGRCSSTLKASLSCSCQVLNIVFFIFFPLKVKIRSKRNMSGLFQSTEVEVPLVKRFFAEKEANPTW